MLGVLDASGIERIHPRRAGRRPQQIGRQGLSNQRWMVGGTRCLLWHQEGLVVGWDGATAHGAATPFPWLMRHVDGRLSVWSDTACHAAAGDPAARTLWPRGAWEDRMLVATVRSMLTVVCHLHKAPCGRTFQPQPRYQGPARWAVTAYVPRLITSPSS